MANTIKHKRGSGSDPSASDLVSGELAIRTDTGVVFTKKDDGTVAQIAGGGDTDLGVSTTTTAVTVTSSTGNNATISEASSSAAGVMSAAHHDKLDGIASGATANSTESIQDIVGGMVSGNSESGISVTYQDGDGTLDFSVASQTDNNFTTTLKNKLDGIAAGAEVNVATNLSVSTTTTTNTIASSTGTNATIGEATGSAAGLMSTTHHNKLDGIASGATANSTESIQDIVGAMVSGNSESGITVTYQDGDGTIDFSVSSQTDNNFTTTLKNKLDGIESGATADQSASEILTAIKTVDGSGSGLDADTLDGVQGSSFLRSDAADTMSGNLTVNARLDVGNGSGSDTEIRIYKADNNVSDHIQFYNGTTRVGEIGCHDTSWLRINQSTSSNIYTPRYIRADNGFFVDGTSKGINGSGNFIGGTIAGASDYGTLLRSDTGDTASGDITFAGGGGAATIGANSDIRFTNGNWTGESTKIQHHGNYMYIQGGSNGIIFRSSGGTDRARFDSSGHFRPSTDNTYDIGTSSVQWRNAHFDGTVNCDQLDVDGSANITGNIDINENIRHNGDTNTYFGFPTNDAFRVVTAGAERFRITNTGAIAIEGSSNYGSSGQVLTSNGNDAPTWQDGGGTVASGCVYENSQTISSNYSVTSGKNAMSAGPITIASGVTVTVTSGSTYTIV